LIPFWNCDNIVVALWGLLAWFSLIMSGWAPGETSPGVFSPSLTNLLPFHQLFYKNLLILIIKGVKTI
jgi:hypothetical protein